MAKLDTRLEMRISSDDYQALSDLAQKRSKHTGKKVSVSSVARSLMNSALDRSASDSDSWDFLVPALEEIRRYRLDLAKVGGNMNQIAHVFSSGGGVSKRELESAHDDLRNELVSVVKALRRLESDFQGKMY